MIWGLWWSAVGGPAGVERAVESIDESDPQGAWLGARSLEGAPDLLGLLQPCGPNGLPVGFVEMGGEVGAPFDATLAVTEIDAAGCFGLTALDLVIALSLLFRRLVEVIDEFLAAARIVIRLRVGGGLDEEGCEARELRIGDKVAGFAQCCERRSRIVEGDFLLAGGRENLGVLGDVSGAEHDILGFLGWDAALLAHGILHRLALGTGGLFLVRGGNC